MAASYRALTEPAAAPPAAAPAGPPAQRDQLSLRLEAFEDLCGLKLSPEDHDLVETLGGLVMTRLGRISEVDDEITLDGRTLRVEAMDGMRVSRLRLLPAEMGAELSARTA